MINEENSVERKSEGKYIALRCNSVLHAHHGKNNALKKLTTNLSSLQQYEYEHWRSLLPGTGYK